MKIKSKEMHKRNNYVQQGIFGKKESKVIVQSFRCSIGFFQIQAKNQINAKRLANAQM